MKQHKPLSKLVKKIGNVILPLISGKRLINTDLYRYSISGDVKFQNLRIYDTGHDDFAGSRYYQLRVDVEFKGIILRRKNIFDDDYIMERLKSDLPSYAMCSYIMNSGDYHTSDRQTKMLYTKKVKESLHDYITQNLYRMVRISHLLPNGVIKSCEIDKIIYK